MAIKKHNIKKTTPEEAQKNNSAVQPTEAEKETMALTDELATKKAQLKNDEVNLYGGNVNIGQGVQYLEPLPKRIKVMNRSMEKLQLQIDGLEPVMPKFKFETDPRYIEIQKEELSEEKASKVKHLEETIKLRDELKERVPKTKVEINEIEKKLKVELTDFKKEKLDYIG